METKNNYLQNRGTSLWAMIILWKQISSRNCHLAIIRKFGRQIKNQTQCGTIWIRTKCSEWTTRCFKSMMLATGQQVLRSSSSKSQSSNCCQRNQARFSELERFQRSRCFQNQIVRSKEKKFKTFQIYKFVQKTTKFVYQSHYKNKLMSKKMVMDKYFK